MNTQINNISNQLNNKANSNHTHDERYALKNHTHSEYADKNHTHSNYADKTHTHTEYADKTHTHFGINTKDDLDEYIDKIANPWWRKLFKGLGWAVDIGDTAYIAGLQVQINSIMGMLAGIGVTDTAQTTSMLGNSLLGVSSKLSDAGDFIKALGENFDSISDFCNDLGNALKEGAERIDEVRKTVDNITGIAKEFQDGYLLGQDFIENAVGAGNTATTKLPLLDITANGGYFKFV